ncbi:MAG: PH domain-containing protein [Gammaproteobacteria bacterium]|nr:PH domain-containing protein [Gammaproteobacteria bacterium]
MASPLSWTACMFDNDEISPGDLPSVDTIDWQSMDPKLLRRNLTASGIALVFVVAGIGFLQVVLGIAFADENSEIKLGWLWVLPVLIAIPLFSWPPISFPRKGYAVRDKDIVYKNGVFWRTVTAIPFNRIQHVEKSSTPLDRRFQLATLQLFTAGGSGGDLKIHGLPTRTAEKMRVFILEKVGAADEQD